MNISTSIFLSLSHSHENCKSHSFNWCTLNRRMQSWLTHVPNLLGTPYSVLIVSPLRTPPPAPFQPRYVLTPLPVELTRKSCCGTRSPNFSFTTISTQLILFALLSLPSPSPRSSICSINPQQHPPENQNGEYMKPIWALTATVHWIRFAHHVQLYPSHGIASAKRRWKFRSVSILMDRPK